MRLVIIPMAVVAVALTASTPAVADAATAAPATLAGCSAEAPHSDPWAVAFAAPQPAARPAPLRYVAEAEQAPPARRPVAFEYSDGYKTRAKIHKIVSFTTLPLFVANYVVGQDLYNHPGDESKKGLHGGLAGTTAVLFGANSVLGVWNLWEGRKDPNHRSLRMTHGILMLASGAGFLATAMLAPNSEGDRQNIYTDYSNQRSTHRAVALTSMGVATVGYLIMLFGSH